MIKVGIVGGTGYTGVELLRLLVAHSEVELCAITSRSEQGVSVADIYPNLRGHCELKFTAPDIDQLEHCDLVFYATPNGVAMQQVPALLDRGVRVVDISADFRLRDTDVWAKWYGQEHSCPDLVAQAVYGLPEVNREQLVNAALVANPGCYPTAVQLGFMPLLANAAIDSQGLIADAKSGVSGAGRQANTATLLCEAGENFKAYGVPGHRHLPEICQGLDEVSETPVQLTFTPHLVPMIRGIHATLYAQLNNFGLDLQSIYQAHYRDEPFVDVMPAGSHPETRSVKGANNCRIAVHVPQGGNTVVVLSVIDNLVKGAAGQAVQNMNIMFGLSETAGLNGVAMLP